MRIYVALGLVTAVLVAACGKSGGVANLPPNAGLYHLETDEAPWATSLDLRADGTFTVRREACDGIGDLECGGWSQDAISPSGHVAVRDDMYWPTPTSFRSNVMKKLTLRSDERGDLVVVGESDWAGSFVQHWKHGRMCASACERAADGPVRRRCDAPLPACARHVIPL